MGWGTHFYIWSSRKSPISRELGMCMGKNTQVGGSHFCDVWTHTWILGTRLKFALAHFGSQKWNLNLWCNGTIPKGMRSPQPFRFGIKKGHFGLFRIQTQRSPLLTHLCQGSEASDPEPAASAPFWACSPSHSQWSEQSPGSEGIPLCRSARS